MYNQEVFKIYTDCGKNNKAIFLSNIAASICKILLEVLLSVIIISLLLQSLREKKYKKFVIIFIIFIIGYILIQITDAITLFTQFKIDDKIRIFIRQSYFDRIIEYPPDSYKDSDILNQINLIPTSLYHTYRNFANFWIQFFSLYFAFTCFIFWYNVKFGLIFMLFSALLITGSIFYFQKIQEYVHDYYHGELNIISFYDNILNNNETIVSFQTKNEEIKNIESEENMLVKLRQPYLSHTAILEYCVIFVTFIVTIALSVVFYKKMLRQELESWKFVTFITIMIFFLTRLSSIFGNFSSQVYNAGTSLNIQKMYEKFPQKNTENDKTQKLENFDLHLKNVNFLYNDSKILDNINLDIPFGRNLLIKGPIGSGKSTIARLIMKWYSPCKDSVITLGKKPINDIPKKLLHENLYYMTQNTNLFSDKTILENIFYKQKLNMKKLEKLNLPYSFTKNYHKKVLQSGINISGGTKRLVHVLRCFFHSAKIVIMDEPTDSLDEKTTEIVMDLIKVLQKEKTVICISHDSRLNNLFENIYYLKK